MLDTGKKRRWATYQNDPIKTVSSYICWSSNVSIIEIHAKKIWCLMHYNEKWKANRINCKFLRMIKSCYQVSEKGWYTIKCTLQTHLCHNNDVPGCAPAPGEVGKLPQVFFFHKQYILSSLCFIIYQWVFFRDLTVISKYLFGMISAHCGDEFYLIWKDFHEGHMCISMGKGGNCILLDSSRSFDCWTHWSNSVHILHLKLPQNIEVKSGNFT